MDETPQQQPRAMFAFWVAAALALSGAIGPLLLAGVGSRVNGVAIPFVVAAAAFGVCTRFRPQSRGTATALYFIGGLAIVYGMLYLVAIPLRVAVLGTCVPQQAPCTAGAERALTDGESTSIAFGIAFGMVAILVGFFGLASLYRRRAMPSAAPPARRIAPVAAVQEAARAAAPAAPPPVAVDETPSIPDVATSIPAPVTEPEAPLELSAPAEALELPPPTPEVTPELPPPAPETASESQPPAAQRRTRRPRAPKPPPEDPTPQSSDA